MSLPVGWVAASGAPVQDSRPRRPLPDRVPALQQSDTLWRSLQEAERTLLDVPGPEAFQGYRQAVQQLMQSALAGAQVVDAGGVSARGRFRRMTLVVGIRQELETIRSATLQQAAGVDLLRHVDLLRGLLLDLFL